MGTSVSAPVDTVVVGGGVVGLCVAEALGRHDAVVAVIDRGRCGGGASAGNAGWITPALSSPLPAPGTVSRALRWMVNPRSPLLVRPSVRPSFLRWSYAFWRSTRPHRHMAGMSALAGLADSSLAAFDRLRDAGVEFDLYADGLLFLGLSESALDSELGALRTQQGAGYRGRLEPLTASVVHELEPLAADSVVGGILAPDERHVRPETFTRGLVRHLRTNVPGASILENTPVAGLRRDGSGWVVDLAGDALRCTNIVIAAGADSAELLRPLGIDLPLIGAKGYSLTASQSTARPRRPVYLLEAKVGISPYEDALRCAGTLELGARDLSLNRARLAALNRAAARYLRDWRTAATPQPWAGLRPLLPDGLPAIGEVPGHDGLFVATGHAMLGVTLAPATADALAPVVLGGRPATDLSAFSPARFSDRAARARQPASAKPQMRPRSAAPRRR